ncbi:MAG: MFS transporter, partial [Sutterella wadsworthensis]
MKDRLWTKQYLLVIVTNFLLYVVYYQLMLWTTSYAMHVWKADVSEAGLAAGLFGVASYSYQTVKGQKNGLD